jgi:hypothetical protein
MLLNQKIILLSDEHRNLALAIIKALPRVPMCEIIIQEYGKDRSKDQNALYWKWLTIIGNELGETKEDVHERYKDKFLVHIYERDNPEYAEMIQALRSVWQQGMKKEAVGLRKKIVALTSTTTASVKQMVEYMENVERDAAGLAIMLPHPDEGERRR